jgi:hypothetical protein
MCKGPSARHSPPNQILRLVSRSMRAFGTQGSRRAAGFLRLPRRALEASTNEQRHRKRVHDDPPPHGAIQGMSFEQDRACHDLQTCRGRRDWRRLDGHNRLSSRSSDRKLKPPPDLFRHQNSALARRCRLGGTLEEASWCARSPGRPLGRLEAVHGADGLPPSIKRGPTNAAYSFTSRAGHSARTDRSQLDHVPQP